MNASFLEIVQTVAAGLGAGLTSRAMVGADLNLLALTRSGLNGNRRVIALKNVRVERCVLGVQTLLFCVGLASCFLAPPPYSLDDTMTPEQRQVALSMGRSVAVTRLGMTAGSLILMYLSYRTWLDERIPIRADRRETDARARSAPPSALATAAQAAASQAQATASVAQDSASAAQNTATLAQDAASDVRRSGE